MNKPLKQLLIVLMLAFAVGLSGCATTKEVEALRADVQKACSEFDLNLKLN